LRDRFGNITLDCKGLLKVKDTPIAKAMQVKSFVVDPGLDASTWRDDAWHRVTVRDIAVTWRDGT
jgi:hypothetical protein